MHQNSSSRVQENPTPENCSPGKMSDTIIMQVQRLRPSASVITDASEQSYYWNKMLTMWNLPSHIKHFPGANPTSIERSDLSRLKADDFIASLKSDGVRYMLLMTVKPNSIDDPIAIMIDRTKTMYEIEVWANEDYFILGSLYDGELVWQQNTLSFVIFDVILAKGVGCHVMSYRERLQILQNTILCVSSSHAGESIEQMIVEESKFMAQNNEYELIIVTKKCVSKENIQELWLDHQNNSHRVDGMVFTLNKSPIEIGTSNSILKWKPSHTIDVRGTYDEQSNLWSVFANSNTSDTLFEITNDIEGQPVKLENNKLLQTLVEHQPCIVECALALKDGCLLLQPERERADKRAPNSMKTILATIRNVQENITIENLIDAIAL